MARVETKIVVPVGVDVAFAVSQTQGEVRYRYDRRIAGYARVCQDPAVLTAVGDASSNNSSDI